MEKTDALGRRRRLSQNRGLRSLFPKLPGEYESRVIRLAMSSDVWIRIERFVSQSSAPTPPRAYGEVIERLLENFDSSLRLAGASAFRAPSRSAQEPIEESRGDWQAWQMQKDLALLAASAPERWQRSKSQLQ